MLLATSVLRAVRPQFVVSRRRFSVHASLSLVVKRAPNEEALGDCPYCHRVMLTLGQKKIPYERILVDLKNKPQWLLEANPAGTVPILKEQDSYIPDSDVIVQYLEEKFPSPPVPEDPEGLEAGRGIFGVFREWMLDRDPDDDSWADKFHKELLKLEKVLESRSSPYLGGQSFNAADARLLPQLYHAISVLEVLKQWSIPTDCPKVMSKNRQQKK